MNESFMWDFPAVSMFVLPSLASPLQAELLPEDEIRWFKRRMWWFMCVVKNCHCPGAWLRSFFFPGILLDNSWNWEHGVPLLTKSEETPFVFFWWQENRDLQSALQMNPDFTVRSERWNPISQSFWSFCGTKCWKVTDSWCSHLVSRRFFDWSRDVNLLSKFTGYQVQHFFRQWWVGSDW